MSFYIGREASKLWKRICAETTTEINLLAENWKYLLAGLVFQYIHGLAARGVHYLHKPAPTLQDVGFFLLRVCNCHDVLAFSYLENPVQRMELGQDKAYISETLFSLIFLSFVLASQVLRIITFYSTQLPGPNYHCREGSNLATLPHPNSVFESLLIVASRKHYTVDVVVAWYTVNLVVFFIDKKLPELPDRSIAAATLLPLSIKDKDGRTKEENHKLLNGNSGDPLDWRQRTQVNGKIMEDGNTLHVDSAMNGA
ncbi:hypothetical protein V8G54_010587 [Vigna mungo]|uniref:Sphingomyelin synthase-like domain-containing protein n=1 Tax=Vigna mungo TaxID=3915 RepID=A0AAQ3NYA0_VIGMU